MRSTFLLPRLQQGYNNERYNICTCGADEKAIIWKPTTVNDDSSSDISSSSCGKLYVLDHGHEQIYACESIDDDTLITAAGDRLNVWDVIEMSTREKCSGPLNINMPQDHWVFHH